MISISDDIKPDGIDSINACLKLQFTKEVDIRNLKHEILKNIDMRTYDLEFGMDDDKYNSKNFEFNAKNWTDTATKRTQEINNLTGTSTGLTNQGRDQLSFIVNRFNKKHHNIGDPG